MHVCVGMPVCMLGVAHACMRYVCGGVLGLELIAELLVRLLELLWFTLSGLR